jgi:hypothetical protein
MSNAISVSVPVEKVVSDDASIANQPIATLRPRSLIIAAYKLKPSTNLHIFLSSYNVDQWFMPCTRIVIPLASAGFTEATADKQSNMLAARTTDINSYDVLDRGDILVCNNGATAVCIADDIIKTSAGLTERVLYVANIKGDIMAAASLTGRSSGSTATITRVDMYDVVDVATGTVQSTSFAKWQYFFANRNLFRVQSRGTSTAAGVTTNSLGSLYGVLVIPPNTYESGIHAVSANDTLNYDPIDSTTRASGVYASSGTLNTFTRDKTVQTTNYITNTTLTGNNTGANTIYWI